MRKIVVPGLIFTFLMCLMYVFSYRQILPSTNVAFAFLLILGYGIIFFVLLRSVKNKHYKQSAKFWVLFKDGVLIATTATLVSSLFSFIYLSYIDTGAIIRQKELAEKVMQQQLEKMGEDSTAFKRNMKEVASLSETPKSIALINIPSSILMYSVFAFFSAAILRTRLKEPDEST